VESLVKNLLAEQHAAFLSSVLPSEQTVRLGMQQSMDGSSLMQRGPHPLLFQLRDNNGIYTDRLGEVGSGGEKHKQPLSDRKQKTTNKTTTKVARLQPSPPWQ